MSSEEISESLADWWLIVKEKDKESTSSYLLPLEGTCTYAALFGLKGHGCQPLNEFVERYSHEDNFRHTQRCLMYLVNLSDPREEVYRNIAFRIAEFRYDLNAGKLMDGKFSSIGKDISRVRVL